MSMTTEQAQEIINKSKHTASETEVPSTEVSKSPEPTADSPEDKAETNDKAEPTTETKAEESDESKANSTEVEKKEEPNKETAPKSKFPQMSKRDYAFIREKDKRRQQKQKYEARIKELEAELERKKGLDYEYFKNQDGTPDPKSYVNWEFKKRDMQDEINALRQQNEREQYDYDMERDRLITERCFQDPQELQEYNQMIAEKGKFFAEAVRERDPNGVVFGYLETLNDYPIVLKELMDLQKNPGLLARVFRSSDPESLKRNIAVVADEILEKRYNPVPQVQPETTATPVAAKPALPVIGKQITNNTTTVTPTVKDRNYWNRWLTEHNHKH